MSIQQPFKVRTEKHRIPGPNGLMLDARLDRPDDTPAKAYAIMSHCFTCTKETLTTSRVSRGLAQLGIAVLRFDFTGLGGSQGRFAESNFSTMVADILSAADYLNQLGHPPQVLLGHSMGGTAALSASVSIDSCQSVVMIASPSEPKHVLHHFGPALNALQAGNDAQIMVAGVAYPVKPQFIDDVQQYDLDTRLKNYQKNILVIRAGQDELVNPKDADTNLARTAADKQLIDINTANHLFSDRQDTQQIISSIDHWLKL